VTGRQYAKIHDCAFHDGHKELSQPGDTTVPPDGLVLGGGVVDGKKEGDRIEGEEEIYVSELNHHGIWLDETRWTRRAVSSHSSTEKPTHNRKPRWGSVGAPELQETRSRSGWDGTGWRGLRTVAREYTEVKTHPELTDNVNRQRAEDVYVTSGQRIDA